MKTSALGKHDEPLRKVVKEWRSDAPLPPHFHEQVWRRIEHEQTQAVPSVWAVVAQWVGRVLPQPALAVSYIAVLLSIGGMAGWTQARQETARVNNELGQRYVRALDPSQAPRP